MRHLTMIMLLIVIVSGPALAGTHQSITPSFPFWKEIDGWGQKQYRGGARLQRVELAGNYPLGVSDPDADWIQAELRALPDSVDLVLFGIADSNRVIILDRRNTAWAAKRTKADSARMVRIETTDNMHEMLNAQLAEVRARRARELVGDRVIVADKFLAGNNDGIRGYLAAWFVRKSGVPSQMPKPISSPMTVVNNHTIKAWFRPSVGAGLQSMEPYGFATPLISGSGGIRLGSTDVGIYALEGQDFQPNLRGLSRYGVQFGDELGWALRLGYQSDWAEMRGDGHTDRRREGSEVGLSYGAKVFSLSGYLNLGWYADRRDRPGRIEPGLALALTFGPVFRSDN